MTNPTSNTTTDQDASKKEQVSNNDLVENKAHGQLGALEDDDEFEEFEAEGQIYADAASQTKLFRLTRLIYRMGGSQQWRPKRW